MPIKQLNRDKVKKAWLTFFNSTQGHWVQKAFILIMFSLIVNHIAASDNFLKNQSYRFPLIGFLFTIILSVVVGILTHFNFKYYEQKYFSKKIETTTILKFIASSLGYITIIYIPVNIFFSLIISDEIQFYYILIGLLITLLICFILIALLYAKDIYNLYVLSIKDAEITIENSTKITKLTYENIACFYSENKIVYIIQNNGTTISSDFTLNELEEKINDQLFFRTNRQTIIHKDTVDTIEKIENGKLRIQLKSFIKHDAICKINISRYKRKAFMDWYQKEL